MLAIGRTRSCFYEAPTGDLRPIRLQKFIFRRKHAIAPWDDTELAVLACETIFAGEEMMMCVPKLGPSSPGRRCAQGGARRMCTRQPASRFVVRRKSGIAQPVSPEEAFKTVEAIYAGERVLLEVPGSDPVQLDLPAPDKTVKDFVAACPSLFQP